MERASGASSGLCSSGNAGMMAAEKRGRGESCGTTSCALASAPATGGAMRITEQHNDTAKAIDSSLSKPRQRPGNSLTAPTCTASGVVFRG